MPEVGARRFPLDGDAVVLAGGMSTRMGRDKALVRLAGATLLDRMVGALGAVFARVSVSIDPTRPYAGIACRQVPDGTPGLGPLEGVRACLEVLRAPALFAAVDLASVSRELAAALWDAAHRPGARAAVPRWAGGLEPAFAVYGPGLLAEIREALGRGERSLRRLAGLAGVAVLDLESPGVSREVFRGGAPSLAELFRNLNAPGDVEAIERRIGGGG